ncbi:MAG: B12-binding domain-containing radical SAM protein [Elusimicrobia bacterium]|nr:B12-binding domain-containing radical SAM protein [Candidatus Liberimonas magnetica]
MRVTLIITPATELNIPSIALCSLAGKLKDEGHTVKVFDLNKYLYNAAPDTAKKEWGEIFIDDIKTAEFINSNKQLIDSTLDLILKDQPEVFCFSIFFSTALMSLKFAQYIKGFNREKTIVFGGPHCHPEWWGKKLIKNENVDAVVIGEGEETLSELLRHLENNKVIDNCPGALLKKDGQIFDFGFRKQIKEINKLPFLDYTWFNPSDYTALPLPLSRGCVNLCTFCSVNGMWGKYRTMTGNRVFEELKYHMESLPERTEFYFCAPLINGNLRELEKLCDLIIESVNNESMKKPSWSGAATFRHQMNGGLLKKMHEAGCSNLTFGLESGSQKIIDKMRKGFRVKDAVRIIKEAKEAGIKTSVNIMFGFPTETAEDFNETLVFLDQTKDYLNYICPSEGLCYFNPLSYVFYHLDEFSIERDSFDELFWESEDKKNTFPERFRRFNEFAEFTKTLNVEVQPSCEQITSALKERLDFYYKKMSS